MIFNILFLAAAVFLFHINNEDIQSAVFMASCITIALVARRQTNIVHLCLILFFFKTAESLVLLFVPTHLPEGEPYVWLNHTYYSVHVIVDSLVLLTIYKRQTIARLYMSPAQIEHKLHRTRADLGLMLLMCCYLVIDLLGMGENLIRNLDYLGFSEEFAKPYWSWTYIYDTYGEKKRTLNLIEFLVIWSTVSYQTQPFTLGKPGEMLKRF